MPDPLTSEAKRSYTILGLLGEGGSGRVYRARMAEGDFQKDVAVKMLHESSPPEGMLAHFRDEARILALFRDRGVVSVEPPVQLAGRWCVIMDYVDGQSLSHILRTLGPLPPTVALELVAEVARVLRNAYNFPGPRGAPLQLLHRDIKPGNIQVTRSGEVRILDFGSARANFPNREADTQEEISGTPGFIAPERLEGIEGPAGDVYSLGVTLWCMLTNETTPRLRDDLEATAQQLAGDDAAMAAALGLALRMRDRDPDNRPSTEEVQASARALASALPGPRLEDWCAQIPLRVLGDDRMKGQRLTETITLGSGGSSRAAMVTAGVGSLLAFTLVGLLGIGAGALVFALLRYPGGAPAPVAEPDAQGQVATKPPPAQPPPRPIPPGMLGLQLHSTPEGATVHVDGALIGKTPMIEPVLPGPHTVRMTKGLFDTTREVDVAADGPLVWHWNIIETGSTLQPRPR